MLLSALNNSCSSISHGTSRSSDIMLQHSLRRSGELHRITLNTTVGEWCQAIV